MAKRPGFSLLNSRQFSIFPHMATNDSPPPPLVRAEDIAKSLAVTPRYVLSMAKEGKIPSVRIGEKCVRFRHDEVLSVFDQPRPE
jgi:excisionase family DNA binding protein